MSRKVEDPIVALQIEDVLVVKPNNLNKWDCEKTVLMVWVPREDIVNEQYTKLKKGEFIIVNLADDKRDTKIVAIEDIELMSSPVVSQSGRGVGIAIKKTNVVRNSILTKV